MTNMIPQRGFCIYLNYNTLIIRSQMSIAFEGFLNNRVTTIF